MDENRGNRIGISKTIEKEKWKVCIRKIERQKLWGRGGLWKVRLRRRNSARDRKVRKERNEQDLERRNREMR